MNTGVSNEYISFYFRCLETQTIKAYANHTMLTPPPPLTRSVLLVVSKISTHLCRSRPKLIYTDLIRKTQPRASTVELQLTSLFKILKFSGPYLPGMTSTTHPIHSNVRPVPFPVWGFIITEDDYHILSAQKHRVAQSLTNLSNKI